MRESAGGRQSDCRKSCCAYKTKCRYGNTVLSAAVWHTLARVTRANSEACARIPWFFQLHAPSLPARCHRLALMYHSAPSSSKAGAAAIALPLASPCRHGRPQVLHHRLPQPRRLRRRLALGHPPPLLQQRADELVRDAIEEVLSLAPPRHSLVMRIAVPTSPIHASLSATPRQTSQSRPHSTGVAAYTHLATRHSLHDSIGASSPRT